MPKPPTEDDVASWKARIQTFYTYIDELEQYILEQGLTERFVNRIPEPEDRITAGQEDDLDAYKNYLEEEIPIFEATYLSLYTALDHEAEVEQHQLRKQYKHKINVLLNRIKRLKQYAPNQPIQPQVQAPVQQQPEQNNRMIDLMTLMQRQVQQQEQQIASQREQTEQQLTLQREVLRQQQDALQQQQDQMRNELSRLEDRHQERYEQFENARERDRQQMIQQADLQTQAIDKIGAQPAQNGHNHKNVGVKLPTLTIEPFYGDVTKWPSFWDQYEISIHNDRNITDVQKLIYLKSFLRGSALRSLDGLSIIDESYEIAVQLLKEHHNNPDLMESSHTRAIDNLRTPTDDPEQLKRFLDLAENHTRSLIKLGTLADENAVSNGHTVRQIVDKLPFRVKEELRKELRSQQKRLTLKNVFSELREIIQFKESIGFRSQNNRNNNSNGNGNNYQNYQPNSGQIRNQNNNRWQNNNQQQNRWSNNSNFRFNNNNNPRPNFNGNHQYNNQNRYQSSQSNQNRSTVAALVNRSSPKCVFCEESHFSNSCGKFPTPGERLNVALRKKICTKCLGKHPEYNCHKTCYFCKQGHHSSFCARQLDRVNVNTVTAETNNNSYEKSQDKGTSQDKPHCSNTVVTGVMAVTNQQTDLTKQRTNREVFLETAYAKVFNVETGKFEMCRILTDSGAQRSFIKRKISKKLKLNATTEETMMFAGFGPTKPVTQTLGIVKLCIETTDGSWQFMQADETDVITHDVRKASLDINKYPILKKVKLAEPLSENVENLVIDLMIGNDYYNQFVGKGEFIELEEGLELKPSKLGYLIAGRLDVPQEVEQPIVVNINTISAYSKPIEFATKNFEPELQKIWELEGIGVKDNPQSTNDNVQENFNKTVKFNETTKRYQVEYTWKNKEAKIGSNERVALRRLRTEINKMRNHEDPELLKKYDEIFQEQLKLGIIEKVTPEMLQNDKIYYIPHRAVIKLGRATTKIRIVYDASSSDGIEFSLNELLNPGPVGLEDIVGLLIRFRTQKIALTADIEKAFLQIEIAPHERDVNRLFWIKDINNPDVTPDNLQIFRFARVGFGVNCSPYLLMATLRQLLNEPEIADDFTRKLSKELYVDNMFMGAETVDEAVETYKKAKETLAKGHFNLREWASNSREVMDSLPEIDRAKGTVQKVLGIQWDTEKDELNISDPNLHDMNVKTKRELTRATAKIFDCLGLVAPLVLAAKVLMQESWIAKRGWDEPLTEEIQQAWDKIKPMLEKIHEIKFPRMIGPLSDNETRPLELHCFTDASAKAYAAVIYLRILDGENTQTFFVFAKSRLAPVKELTITRLELMGTLIGSRILKFIRTELRREISRQVLWTDSKCCLGWINSNKVLPIFIQNRVQELKTNDKLECRYVPTKDNPADYGSRIPKSIHTVDNNKLWLHGPNWLIRNEQLWPKTDNYGDSLKRFTETELQTVACVHTKNVEQIPTPFDINIEHFSTLTKLLSFTALIRRLFTFWKKKVFKQDPQKARTAADYKWARLTWEKYAQQSQYSKLITDLKENRKLDDMISTDKSLITQLGVFLDEQGFIRCNGRIQNANLPMEAKCPKLLPKGHYFTKLVIEDIHERLMHAGANATLAQLRQNYWIPQGGQTVKFKLHKCSICKRHGGKFYTVPGPPPLPESRVLQNTPFISTSLDFLGPIHTQEKTKLWMCLFVCMVTKAVHIELLEDATAEAFINAFKRFVSRKGKPALVYSDNAKIFKVAEGALKIFWENFYSPDEKIQNYIAKEGIIWAYSIPNAPWYNGLTERIIQGVKRCMKRVIGRNLLTYEQLHTLCCEIESVLNSRPLVTMSEDIQQECITPAKLLFMNYKTGFPPIEAEEDSEWKPKASRTDLLREQLESGQKMLNHFWKIWNSDYLLTLRDYWNQRFLNKKDTADGDKPKIGTVVLIHDKLRPRAQWKKARIESLIISKDGKCRAVNLRLPQGKVIKRAIKVLCPLEIPLSEDKV